jgi:hypothetical protein
MVQTATPASNAASDPADLVELNGRVFQRRRWLGPHRWQSDGSNADTDLITDITAFSRRRPDEIGSSEPSAADAHGRELWKTAGAITDTLLVEDTGVCIGN